MQQFDWKVEETTQHQVLHKMLLIGRHTSNFIIVTSRAVDRCQRVKVERGRSCAGVTTRRGAVVDQQLSSVVCIIAV